MYLFVPNLDYFNISLEYYKSIHNSLTFFRIFFFSHIAGPLKNLN